MGVVYGRRNTVNATGGTETEITQNGKKYRVHTFTSVGSSTFTVLRGGMVEYLVVAGGGGGGSARGGGGGGAGGLLSGVISTKSNQYAVLVGSGGDAPANKLAGENGQNSSIFDIVAIGGGGGGGVDTFGTGQIGGSGGGAIYISQIGASGIEGQGNNGGNGSSSSSSSNQAGGGGGGAGQPGESATNSKGGDGGDGLYFSWLDALGLGDNGWFAGGGAGSKFNVLEDGYSFGGLGGGGDGGLERPSENRKVPTPGVENTGGGGAGSGFERFNSNTLPRNGGSGIVIIRYRIG